MPGSGYNAILISVKNTPLNIGFRFLDNANTRIKVYTRNLSLDEYCLENGINQENCSVQEFIDMLSDLSFSD